MHALKPHRFRYAWPNSTHNASLVPLSLYYNAQWGDHFSTSTAAGHAYAEANGYTLLEAAQAYVTANATLLNQLFYEGVFQHIERSYPLDFYWIWTPEDWEWGLWLHTPCRVLIIRLIYPMYE